ncbi:MAG: DNA repair protein RecO [Candidatus Doudnabacteria bacterium]
MLSIILKKSLFSEGHEIVTMYSRELGKVRGIARSIKSPKSKLSFALQSLFYTDVDLLQGKMNTIKGVKAVNTFTNIYADSEKVYLALFATEIILKSTADEQPNEELFDLYLSFLEHLNNTSGEHPCAGIYALKALALNGYALNYRNCSICGINFNDGAEVSFSNRKSGFIGEECRDKVSDAYLISRGLHRALLEGENIPAENFKQAFELMDKSNVRHKELQKLVESFLTYILERNLNTPAYLGTL